MPMITVFDALGSEDAEDVSAEHLATSPAKAFFKKKGFTFMATIKVFYRHKYVYLVTMPCLLPTK
jgi:hypothetical protein